VAALNGGRNAVIRTVIFDLWNRKIIDIIKKRASGKESALRLKELTTEK